jgi:hypothetical protein
MFSIFIQVTEDVMKKTAKRHLYVPKDEMHMVTWQTDEKGKNRNVLKPMKYKKTVRKTPVP